MASASAGRGARTGGVAGSRPVAAVAAVAAVAGSGRRAVRLRSWDAVPSSSARNGDGREASPRTATRCRPRVMATWRTRRSSSTSSARRWGMSPAVAPKTTTRSHSRPFTRCTVDSVTPPGVGSRRSTPRSHGSKEAASGWRAATWARASRSSRWLDPPSPARDESSMPMAPPRPISSRITARAVAVVPVATASGHPAEVGRQLLDLGADLHVVDAGRHRRQPVDRQPPPQPLREPLGEAPGRPPVDLDHVGPVDVLGVGADAEVGEGGPHAGAVEDAGPQGGVDGRARLDQGHLGGEEQGVDPGQDGDVAGFDARLGQPGGDGLGDGLAPGVGGVEADGEGALGRRRRRVRGGSAWPPAGRCRRGGGGRRRPPPPGSGS